jgi:hypothetical protein
MAYQLDLHLPRKDPFPVDEHEARLVIVSGNSLTARLLIQSPQNRERTWICKSTFGPADPIALFCFDTTWEPLTYRAGDS